ncbi:serine hydrolase family protein [Candidatus Peregrinibacteria bacterium]|jgi:uncharacterized protein|nr:serine hydrolase family protein [Candidatus Peregrinibacteria bacterium]MBT3598253.1 serine hydrolase family protein [Candidatus Peregrinibacteria bacterium]MBT4366777.1 serine hydrolase family protein [Candidatus Peregrinibacteria bacterium]MBT4585574.1 serine hydrolase family protein [Candidatus Peregrinibacteria bacterium]MBT6731002.1 serine hydrolase family protein [Candidatus Peregrinibacteria bacterium]
MDSKKRFFLIHGWGGHPNTGWQPWLSACLESKGHEVKMLKMPNTDSPRLTEWVQMIEEAIGEPDESCILVGHSLGCISIVRYLERLKDNQKIGGAVLVSSFYEDLGDGYEEINEFIKNEADWELVKIRSNNFSIIHSEDDPVVPIVFAERLAKKLGIDVCRTLNRGHFSEEDSRKDAPEILSIIERVIN